MLRLLVLLTNLAVLVLSADKFSRDDFPPDFVFGASTSAYQIEGAANQDGRTPSIWDTFAQAGNMHGATGDTACDGYHKYKEDVQLMRDTGLEAYRFSISWSRLLPNGRGTINPKGLQYYNNLINELISHGIQPHVTLHHSDLPQTLEDEYGGWISRKSVKDFEAYADVCFRKFGDRVPYWTTFNEANVFVMGGYDAGNLPPQRCSSPSPYGLNCSRGNSSIEPYLAAHHILLAHASAARLYKNKYQDRQHGFIGINVLAYWFVPLTNSSDDQIAAQRANDFFFGWILDPLVFGEYPDAMKKNVGSRMPIFTTAESNWIKGSFDFLGVNHYSTSYAKDNPSSLKIKKRDFFADMAVEFLSMLQTQKNPTKEFHTLIWLISKMLCYLLLFSSPRPRASPLLPFPSLTPSSPTIFACLGWISNHKTMAVGNAIWDRPSHTTTVPLPSSPFLLPFPRQRCSPHPPSGSRPPKPTEDSCRTQAMTPRKSSPRPHSNYT